MRKYALPVFLTVFWGLIAFVVGKWESKNEFPVTLLLEKNGVVEEINPWYNENDDTFYFFVPTYSHSGEMRFVVDDSSEFICESDGTPVEKMHSDCLSTGDVLLFEQKSNKARYHVKVTASKNVAAVFIDTASGNLKSVLNDKNVKEVISFRLYNEQGQIEYESTELQIKGRGNSTWKDKEKKPFNILSKDEVSFFGKQASSKWVLLANLYDSSNMRNKLALDTARKLGLEMTPEGDYVELYLNGEYYGLYFLCQSVEALYEKTCKSDDFAIKLDLANRISDFNNPLSVIYEAHSFDIVYPKALNAFAINKVNDSVALLNDRIAGKNVEYLKNLDVDSWVNKYLIDEVFANYDSMSASSYFTLTEKNGEPFFSVNAVWDFDNSLGNRRAYSGSTRNPRALYARFPKRGIAAEDSILWYSTFYETEQFYQQVVEKFFDTINPMISELIEEDIPSLDDRIALAAENNQTRWNYSIPYDEEVVYLTEYLRERQRFLGELWGKEKHFSVVTFEGTAEEALAYYFFVEKGMSLSETQNVSELVDLKHNEWVNKNTGKALNLEEKIENDTVFWSDRHVETSLSDRLLGDKAMMCIMSIIAIALMTAVLLAWEKRTA